MLRAGMRVTPGRIGEDGNRIGDTQRKAAATPSAGGDSANGIRGVDFEGSKQRGAVGALDHADLIALQISEV